MKRKAKMFDCDEAAGGYWLQTPFNQGFIDDLKGEIPKYAREWDAFRKMWWVSQDYEEEVLLLARRYYDIETPPALQGAVTHTAWDILYLRPGAPQEVVRAAYRALAVIYHPDHGGNVQIMKEINLAFEEVSRNE